MNSDIAQASLIVILGMGNTGLSCARFLSKHNAALAMMDSREQPPALATIQHELPAILIKAGGFDAELLAQASLVIVSPGIDCRQPVIQNIIAQGIEVMGDIELFARYAQAPIVAITGSNGKSTVTTLVAEMAKASNKSCLVGGNLGTPALELLEQKQPAFYLLEISSFQLETVSQFNPFVSVVLNVSPDHMDRYDSEIDYQQTKAKIYQGDGIMVINLDDAVVRAMTQPERNSISFSSGSDNNADFSLMLKDGKRWLVQDQTPLLAVEQLQIVGKHNLDNALAALALGSAMGLTMAAMIEALMSYQGLAHRCRLVDQIEGVRWFNDSKATNVGACIAAIDSLAQEGELILIAGGVGKSQDFSVLKTRLAQQVKAVILFGQDADDIAQHVPEEVSLYHAINLADAVQQAKSIAVTGDNVLLSPACASFDMFKGYEQRGEQFEHEVRKLALCA